MEPITNIWENVFDFRISEDLRANISFDVLKLYDISGQKDVVSTNHQGDFKPF